MAVAGGRGSRGAASRAGALTAAPMGIVDEDVERVRLRERSRRRRVEARRAAKGRPALDWPVPVPRGADAVVLGQRRARPLLLLRLPGAGDVITFVREIEHLDFVGAVEWLAARSGITLRYTTAGEGRERQRRKRLVEAMAAAVEWYHDRLLSSGDAAAGPVVPAVTRATTARWCATTSSAGRPTSGTRCAARSSCPTTCCATPASAS